MPRLVFTFFIIATSLTLRADAQAAKTQLQPKVWVFIGIPGNKEYTDNFKNNTARLVKAFDNQFDLPKSNITVLFGKGKETAYKACNRENMIAEFDKIRRFSQTGAPLWVIFAGHANSTKKGVNFNIAGKDLNMNEIAAELKNCGKSPVGLFMALPAANRFLKPLAAKNRLVVSAVTEEDEDNQPHYFSALVESFEKTDNDVNRDGYLSALEVFNGAKAQVEDYFVAEGMLQSEQSIADGNGNGKGALELFGRERKTALNLKLEINELH